MFVSTISYDQRSTILFKTEFIYHMLTATHNMRRVGVHSFDSDHPLEMVLGSIKLDDRLAILARKEESHIPTPLHAACQYNDILAVKCIIHAVQDRLQRMILLYNSKSALNSEFLENGKPLLTKAVESSSREVVSCLINCLSLRDMLTIFKNLTTAYGSPFRGAIERDSKEVLFLLLGLLRSAYPTNARGLADCVPS